MIWCCPPPPPAARGSSPARTRCTSATATPPSAMCGIFTTPTAAAPTGWPSWSCRVKFTKCGCGTSAPPTGWITSSPTPTTSPGASKSITGGTATSSIPAATSTRPPLWKRRTFIWWWGGLPGTSASTLLWRPAPGWASGWWSSVPAARRNTSRRWPGRMWSFWAAACPMRRSAAGICGPKPSCSPARRISASPPWRPRAPAPRCWPMAGAAPARQCCPAKPATGLRNRRWTALRTASASSSGRAWRTAKRRYAPTAAASASSALNRN